MGRRGIWFADERCVPPEDEESNYRLAAETLLRPAGINPALVHRMEGELGPEEGSRRYAEALRAGFTSAQTAAGRARVAGARPDRARYRPRRPCRLAVSGGADARRRRRGALSRRPQIPKPPPERITLSLGVLRAARRCLLLATGAGKADAIAAALGEPTHHVPASLLVRERLTVIVDDAASPSRAWPAPCVILL